MKRISMKGFVAVAAFALLTLGAAQPSLAKTTDNGGLRSSKIDSGDRMESPTEVIVNGVAVGGAPSVSITETQHFINEPFFFWSHNTRYTIKRTVTASWADRVGAFVAVDGDGQWYEVQPGTSNAAHLPGKPQVSIGEQANTLGSNDRGSLNSVGAGDQVGGTPRLKASYSYVHSEPLDDVSYTVSTMVGTTFVADQNAYFARVSGNLYRVDQAGRIDRLNDKPSTDRGQLNNMIDRNDSTASYPDVTYDRGFFEASWQHVHEEDFEHVRYTTLQEVRADYVPEANANMAWIDGTEYSVDSGSNYVERLSQRPVVNLGRQSYSIGNDRAVAVDVYSVNGQNVVVRYSFHRNETYVAKEYYVDRSGTLSYDTSYQVWTLNIDGNSYVVAWDSDNYSGNATVLHAPAGSSRPQYVVPSTSGDGLPPAVVPGADNGYNTAPPPAPQGGIPGRAPQGIPGRTPAPQNNCIPGRPCNN